MTTTARNSGNFKHSTTVFATAAALLTGLLLGAFVFPTEQANTGADDRVGNEATAAEASPSVVIIAIPNGPALRLPAELAVDLVGGETGVHAPFTVSIPGGDSITLPAFLAVDLVGGETGVDSPFTVISIPGGGSITLPSYLGIDLIGGETGVE